MNTYRKGIVVGVALLTLVVGPLSVGAISIGELQAQVQSLLTRIGQLQGGAAVTLPSAGVASSPDQQYRVCSLLGRNLGRGSQGDDVRSLQEFLQSRGYLSASATGYYGAMTGSAVAQWQASEGVSAVGAFGPLSRERMKVWCGGGSTSNAERFEAVPSRGAPPLSVVFNTWISGFRVASTYYVVDFGDGISERAANCYAPADACMSPGQNTHVYTQAGTYTAVLNRITDPCQGNQFCRAAIQQESVAKVQVEVGGAVACTKEYSPVCGGKQVVCITAPCNPVPTTYSNRCMLNADGAQYLYEGQCQSVAVDPAADPQCKSWYDGCNSCSRSSPGGMAACTLRYCPLDSMARPYCTAYFDGSTTNRPPTVSGLSGPATLRVGETGTWSVTASDPENGQLSYQITWGDEYQNVGSGRMSLAMQATNQNSSFTHAYATAGTYTVTIVVTDSSGQQAKTSSTVQVTGGTTACTMQYSPVCGRPAGCANTCAPGMVCTMQCQLYPEQTYGNTCALNAAGAQFLYTGECTSALRQCANDPYCQCDASGRTVLCQ